MAVHSYEDLIEHVGHEIVCVTYGGKLTPDGATIDAVNVAIECETCGCVLVDFDRPAPGDANWPDPTSPDYVETDFDTSKL